MIRLLAYFFFSVSLFAASVGDYDPNNSCTKVTNVLHGDLQTYPNNGGYPNCQASADEYNSYHPNGDYVRYIIGSTGFGDPAATNYLLECDYDTYVYNINDVPQCTAPEVLNYQTCSCENQCDVIPDDGYVNENVSQVDCNSEYFNNGSPNALGAQRPYLFDAHWDDCRDACVVRHIPCPSGTNNYHGQCVKPLPPTDDCSDWTSLGQTKTNDFQYSDPLLDICWEEYQCMDQASSEYGKIKSYYVMCGGQDKDEGDETTPDEEDPYQDENTTGVDGDDEGEYCDIVYISHNPDVCKEECFSDETHYNLISSKPSKCTLEDTDDNSTDNVDVNFSSVNSRLDVMIDQNRETHNKLDTLIENSQINHYDLEDLKTINKGIDSSIDQVKDAVLETNNKLSYLISGNKKGFQDLVNAIEGQDGFDDSGVRSDLDAIRQAIEDKNLSGSGQDLEEYLYSDDVSEGNFSDGSAGFGQYSEDIKGSFDQFKVGDVLGISSSATPIAFENASFSFMGVSITMPIGDWMARLDLNIIRALLLFFAVILGFRDVMRGS